MEPTPENAQKIVEFLDKYHTTDVKYFPAETLFDKLIYYKATSCGELVGYSAYSNMSEWRAMTHTTCVHPKFRGKGFGRKITEHMEEIIRAEGFGKITCEVYSTNFPMLNLKLSQGYVIEGFHPDHYDPGRHEYSLGKILK